MQIVCAQWNHDGSVLAIGGVQVTDDKESNLVQFFNPWGTVTKDFWKIKFSKIEILFSNIKLNIKALENPKNSWHKN